MLKHSINTALVSIILTTTISIAQADSKKLSRPNDHAPIGIMGDHLHKQGEWMLSYYYKHNRSSDLRNGTNTANTSDLLKVYGEASTKMDMGMHMFEIMYGINDNLTLMLMPHYMEMDMTHLSHGNHGAHAHKIEGWGDTEVTGLYSLYSQEKTDQMHRAHLHLGLSLPTGSTNETFMNHHQKTYHLPYNMQLGSGTFDPILGLTYTGETKEWAWGAQTLNYIRLGKNDEGYRLGNKYTASTWIARNLSDWSSISVRMAGEAWRNVAGQDSSLPITTIVGANPDQQAGERILAYIGLNLLGTHQTGPLVGHRLAAEFGLPLYEHYSGPQPETEYRFTLGWQRAF